GRALGGSGCGGAVGGRGPGATGPAAGTALAAAGLFAVLGPTALPAARGATRVASSAGVTATRRCGAVALARLAEVLEGLGVEALADALRARETAGGRLGDVGVGVAPRRGGVRLRRVVKAELECLVDQLPAGDVVPVDERDGDPGA